MAGARRKSFRRGESGQIPVDDIQLASSTATPEEQARRRESVERLTAAIQKLGERCRELIRLKLLGRSFAEIQEELRGRVDKHGVYMGCAVPQEPAGSDGRKVGRMTDDVRKLLGGYATGTLSERREATAFRRCPPR